MNFIRQKVTAIMDEAANNVAIVGRPNVGKSSLFNLIVGRRIAIVEKIPGVTRDRLSAPVTYEDRYFDIIDTGGIGIEDVDQLDEDVEFQITFAMECASVIVFVVDVRDGVTSLDKTIARLIRHTGKPVILVANKADTGKLALHASDFYTLGFGTPLAVSATEKTGRTELLERIAEHIPPARRRQKTEAVEVAIVGKRNSGKSTLVNFLAKANRVIVSDQPGTTRDSIDVPFTVGGVEYLAIDTAGVRKKRHIKTPIDFYSQARTERSIRRADVVFFMIDATLEISQVDKKILRYVVENYKPVVLALNKWDIVTNPDVEAFEKYINSNLPGVEYAPMTCISAKTGLNVERSFAVVSDLYRQSRVRISTAKINAAVREAFARKNPARKKSFVPKMYYATQVAVAPPTVVIFTNDPKSFSNDYTRYLENTLRSRFDYSEIPIKIVLRPRTRKEKK